MSEPRTSMSATDDTKDRTAGHNFRTTLRATFLASPELEALQKAEFAEKPWPWSMFVGFQTDSAKLVTLIGCCSSAIVLAVRLYLDHTPVAYLIQYVATLVGSLRF
jgi:hypothetical protein